MNDESGTAKLAIWLTRNSPGKGGACGYELVANIYVFVLFVTLGGVLRVRQTEDELCLYFRKE